MYMLNLPRKLGIYHMVCFFAVNTKARKIQLKTELNTLEKRKLFFVNDYGLEIKGIYTYEYLVFINMKVVDDDKVEACLRGLGPQCKSFKNIFFNKGNHSKFF